MASHPPWLFSFGAEKEEEQEDPHGKQMIFHETSSSLHASSCPFSTSVETNSFPAISTHSSRIEQKKEQYMSSDYT